MTRRSAQNYGRKDQKSSTMNRKKNRKKGRKGKPSTLASHSGFEVVLKKSGLEAEPSHHGDQAKEHANDERVLLVEEIRQDGWIRSRATGPNGIEYTFTVFPVPPRPKSHGGPPTMFDDYD